MWQLSNCYVEFFIWHDVKVMVSVTLCTLSPHKERLLGSPPEGCMCMSLSPY